MSHDDHALLMAITLAVSRWHEGLSDSTRECMSSHDVEALKSELKAEIEVGLVRELAAELYRKAPLSMEEGL